MKFIPQSHEILALNADPLKLIEVAGRTCYKSEDKICPGSDVKFARMLLGRHHESVIEHSMLTVRFITNRGVTHEEVRHRIGSFSQESTRYVNYGGGDMQFVIPVWLETSDLSAVAEFENMCFDAERHYNNLLSYGWTAQQAREALPCAVKTEIIHTANFRSWRHILKERVSTAAHPQMRALMIPLLAELKTRVPVIFDDINP